jgi:hypothetical protein
VPSGLTWLDRIRRGDTALALVFVATIVGVLAAAVTLVVRRQAQPLPAYEQLASMTGRMVVAKPHILSKSPNLMWQISLQTDAGRSWTGRLYGWGCSEQQLVRFLGSNPTAAVNVRPGALVTIKHWDEAIVELIVDGRTVLSYGQFKERAKCRSEQ